MTCIVWLRQDLRVADNPALNHALAEAGQVIPAYVHAPEEHGDWRPGAASNWWLHHSLASLDASLRALGSRLTLTRGPSAQTLLSLARNSGATAVYFNRLYEPALAERDRRVERALREAGLEVRSFNASLLFEPWQVATAQGTPYRVFTPFWRACAAQLEAVARIAPPPNNIPTPRLAESLPPLAELGLLPRISWDQGLRDAWQVGESAALAKLEAFCAGPLAQYAEARNRPDLTATTRLSPHLHFGEIGPRQVVATVLQRSAGTSQRGEHRGAETLLKELGWREFAHHLLHHFPATADRPLDERFERFEWNQDAGARELWQRGCTGIPLVDAGMRELWTTGWLHNRVRMIVASFLTKNLRQPWRDGARWFWDTLVDADLANNTLGWQWTAGCGADAAPYIRVFNPVLQAERFDPQRAYLRRWLPEIARLPDVVIHCPWQADRATLAAAGVVLGRDYALPIVDLAASRAGALAAYQAMRTHPRA